MTTAQTLINDAYIEARIVDAIDGAESAQLTVALRFLNRIIGRLSVKNCFIPYSSSENFAITGASASYTMGTSGTASSTRAKKILGAYLRDSSNYDYPLSIISEQDYNRIQEKDTVNRPTAIFYDPVYPVGIIYFTSLPDGGYTCYIESQKDLHSTLTLSTELSLPIEYEDALVVTLAAKLARANGANTEMSLYNDAMSAWKSIMGFNMSQRVPVARLPFSGTTSGDDLFPQVGFPYVFDFILA